MTCTISQLVYMPNFRAIGPSVTEKNGNTETDTHTRQKHKQTKLQVVKTKVSPRLDLISAPDCPTTSQAEKGGPYTHEAQLTSYVVHHV